MPTLGQMIRALRLGYGFTGFFFMRISGDNEPWKIELLPVDGKPTKSNELHRVWWGRGNECADCKPSIVHDIKPLRGVVSVKRPIMFYVNNVGELVS